MDIIQDAAYLTLAAFTQTTLIVQFSAQGLSGKRQYRDQIELAKV